MLNQLHFSRMNQYNMVTESSIRDLTLSKEGIAEIEWRFESLKPYLKPGKFDG